ncbi:glycoside hydrolase family 2 TIM barrel-domain containing protein [Marinimicrobium sp. LS-A18]|uniref:glycoside hydrolase family 2 TIM barrel-domain containing protein n=1 Tax=Marinimicrobium sp. LS-A18 TaxID=1381596 RepID=UPI000686E9E7|nr:glycoside hydrolase family 2 TIM barrel-domain containing protein [Marinimicrobium sp. LS-A18]
MRHHQPRQAGAWRRHTSGLFAGLLLAMGHAQATSIPAEPDTINLNADWDYLEALTETVERAEQADDWSTVSLPHTWNSKDPVDALPGYRRSASWYRKTLTPSASEDALNYVLYFEGANMVTDVYVNGEHAGQHVGGYIGFEIDITEQLVPGQDNTLMVRVSNAYDPNIIPSEKSDFVVHGGLSRDLWLKVLPDVHLSRVQIDTPKVSEEQGQTDITVFGRNTAEDTRDYQLSARLIDPDGHTVAEINRPLSLAPGEFSESLPTETLPRPALWSPDTPNLYQMEVSLVQGDDTTHQLTERYGYRWFEFEEHGAFYLNGERLLLRGTHRHEEHAGLGNALPNEQHREDMRMIKALGANFVRLGHYPQDPEVYRAADELGLIIWDELPWTRGGMGGEEWQANTERLLRQQITQNRNHPSIVFWSLGNEIYWEADFPGGGDPEKLNPYLQHLNDIAHEMDDSRLTAIRKYYEGSHIVDVFSPSIWAGWYGGSYSQYEEALRNAMKEYPRMLHMEYGGSSHVGRHTPTPITKDGMPGAQVDVEEAVNQAVVRSVAKDSDWNESYIVDLFDWHLQVSENLPNYAGGAQWAFKDFATPLRPENPIPYMNQKGMVDRQGRKKDAYYVYASYWKDEPFCYIESHTWTHRGGAEDEPLDITVFCNTDSAQLFVNGKRLDKKQRDPNQFPAGGLVWETRLSEGENQLRVVGERDGRTVAEDQMTVTYIVDPLNKLEKVRMSATRQDDGLLLIEAEAVDKNGDRCITCDERVYFSNVGEAGELLENYGTPDKSSEIEMANGYASILYRPDPDRSSIIELRSQDVKGAYVYVDHTGEIDP